MVVMTTAELEFDGLDVLGHLKHVHTFGRDSLQRVHEALLETQAVRNHQISCVHGFPVSQRRLEGVRVATLRNERGHRDAVLAAHVADHIGPDARRSDHRGHSGGRIRCVNRICIVVGSRARRREQHRSDSDDQPASTDPPTSPLMCASFDRHVCLP